jgi:hypothetical protein
MRSFLQDYYATAGPESGGNTDSATNGADEYDIKVKFGWRGQGSNTSFPTASERQIDFLSNCNNGPLLTGAGQMFENADTVTFIAWGDESDQYMNAINYANKASGGGPIISSNINDLHTYITDAETLAGTNQIWRGVSMNLAGNPSMATLVGGMVFGIGPGSSFSADWTNENLMPVVNNITPVKFAAAGYYNDPVYLSNGGGLTNTVDSGTLLFTGQASTEANVIANGQYYMNILRERLVNAFSFVGI